MTITPEEAFDKSVKAGYKRLPELEDIVMTQLNCCYWYAFYIIGGKLPEKMHNMMILYAIKDPNNYYVKLYFNEVLKDCMALKIFRQDPDLDPHLLDPHLLKIFIK